jgi:predicted GNAT superfamily acetyltransferase
MRTGGSEVTASANDVACAAAERSGVEVRTLHELAELRTVITLFQDIWRSADSSPLMTLEQLRAMSHSGNYLAGAFDGDRMVGACVGFFAAPPGVGLHSHIAGVTQDMRGRNVGFALKLHQRAWALDKALTEITWTFDPLVRRNAYFNLVKLGARPREYLVNFYGEISDAINTGQDTDRLLVGWTLTEPEVVEACDGVRREADLPGPADADVVVALDETSSGEPRVASAWTGDPARTVLVGVPPDIEAMRQGRPDLATRWRRALRDVLGGLVDEGARVTGFARSGYYVVERGAP